MPLNFEGFFDFPVLTRVFEKSHFFIKKSGSRARLAARKSNLKRFLPPLRGIFLVKPYLIGVQKGVQKSFLDPKTGPKTCFDPLFSV